MPRFLCCLTVSVAVSISSSIADIKDFIHDVAKRQHGLEILPIDQRLISAVGTKLADSILIQDLVEMVQPQKLTKPTKVGRMVVCPECSSERLEPRIHLVRLQPADYLM